MLTVRDVMTPRPTAIKQSAPIRSALSAMMELDVRHLPVINEDRELVGMLSDRDFRGLPFTHESVNRLVGGERLPLEAAVSTLMSTDVISVTPEDEIVVPIELMLESKIGAIPVVNPEGRLVGIVSYMDVLRAYQEDLAST
jgi:acetoin utilization protein AcuB